MAEAQRSALAGCEPSSRQPAECSLTTNDGHDASTGGRLQSLGTGSARRAMGALLPIKKRDQRQKTHVRAHQRIAHPPQNESMSDPKRYRRRGQHARRHLGHAQAAPRRSKRDDRHPRPSDETDREDEVRRHGERRTRERHRHTAQHRAGGCERTAAADARSAAELEDLALVFVAERVMRKAMKAMSVARLPVEPPRHRDRNARGHGLDRRSTAVP